MDQKFLFLNNAIDGISISIYAKTVEEAWGVLSKIVNNRTHWVNYK